MLCFLNYGKMFAVFDSDLRIMINRNLNIEKKILPPAFIPANLFFFCQNFCSCEYFYNVKVAGLGKKKLWLQC